MSSESAGLFAPDTVYLPPKGTREEVLTAVSQDLLAKGLVTEGFLPNLLERERSYPTGMDLSAMNPDLPNFAVPHTECEFVRQTRLVPVRLAEPVAWHNMLDPSQKIEVSFLFMILNADMEAQTGILARIMDFINGLGVQGLKDFFATDDAGEIFAFLEKNFPEAAS